MRFGSLFSGIEAASVAWEGLGWSAAWLAEIEPFPSAVLAERWPGVVNLGDINAESFFFAGRSRGWFSDFDFSAKASCLGPVDLICGGSPCQSFSVAGRRLGLADDRGNLALRFVEICDELKPRWVVWENVPGVLNSRDNAFGAVLAGLVGADAPLVLPSGGHWPDAGLAAGPARAVAWRVLDAQYFGLAQRRRRVFVVGLRAGERGHPGQVLFESDRLRRHTPPSRQTGAEPARALTRGLGAGGPDDNAAQAGHLTISKPLTSHASRQDGTVETLLIEGDSAASTPDLPRLRAGCGRGGETAITHTLKGEGFDGSKDGTGRGAPLVVNARQNPVVKKNVSPSLTKCDRGHAVALAENQRGEVRACEVAPAMATGGGKLGRGYPAALDRSAVRRLTPRECERLQGFPDDHTLIGYRGKAAEDCPDGPRYRALGNSMAVPVMRWIGERIMAVERAGGFGDGGSGQRAGGPDERTPAPSQAAEVQN